jgi:putative PIN family toxin of toxin-antitoxin system
MTEPERVVFDCNIFFQALISPAGPAGQAFDAVVDGSCLLFVSEFIFDELKDITSRPHLTARFSLTVERVALFLELIAAIATAVADVPAVFEFPRDPKDARYVDLALAARAKLIVSRDLDLLSLTDPATPEGRDFRARFPDMQILTPTELLRLLNLA